LLGLERLINLQSLSLDLGAFVNVHDFLYGDFNNFVYDDEHVIPIPNLPKPKIITLESGIYTSELENLKGIIMKSKLLKNIKNMITDITFNGTNIFTLKSDNLKT